MKVRQVTVEDISQSVCFKALADDYAKESGDEFLEREGKGTDLKTYRQLQENGLFVSFGAYEGDFLVGFLGLMPFKHIHTGTTLLSIETIFVDKSVRHCAGALLVSKAVRYARKHGIKGVLLSAKKGTDFYESLKCSKKFRELSSTFILEV